MKFRRGKRGFTLVEIMIVVAIIGLLAAIAIPSYVKYRTRARLGACTANMIQIARAAENYVMEADITVATLVIDNTATVDGKLAPAAGTGYLKKIPICPATSDGSTYTYTAVADVFTVACSATGHASAITSAGE